MSGLIPQLPQVIAWETTRACNLACVHCRAEAQYYPDSGQLTTQEGFRLMDQISELSKPILILSGGDPLLRQDIFELATYGIRKGLRVVMSPNGTLLTPEVVEKIKMSGISCISVSLDGSSPQVHDSFRQVAGSFEAAVRGLTYALQGNLSFQINTTVTRRNLHDLSSMLKTVVLLGAVTWDIFMLVPTGRGKIEDEVTSQEYEEVLNWIHGVSRTAPIRIKVTCAPHYMRIVRQKAKERRDSEKDSHRLISQSMRFGFQTGWTGPMSSIDNCFEAHPSCCSESDKFERVIPSDDQESTLKSFFGSLKSISSEQEDHRNAGASVHQSFRRGCLAGTGFCFISHIGDVQPCGYLNLAAGNVRRQSFGEIYLKSELFRNLRDISQLGGKCGYCEYRMICGGCRARAYSVQGDYLAEEPYCIYQPRKREKNSRI